jgi:hypothetical protein
MLTESSLVIRTNPSSDMQFVTKLYTEDAQLLRATHPPLEEYDAQLSVTATILLQYIRAIGTSNEQIRIDFHPTNGCTIRGGPCSVWVGHNDF